MCLRTVILTGKQCRPRSDAALAASDLDLHCLFRHVCPSAKGYNGNMYDPSLNRLHVAAIFHFIFSFNAEHAG